MTMSFFRSDDVFLLGNIALTALARGRGKKVMETARFVQAIRPENTTGFMIEAMYLHSTGKSAQALEVMERSRFEEATSCADEGRAMHLFLLAELDRYDEVMALGRVYLKGGGPISEAARHTIESVLNSARDTSPSHTARVSL